MIGFTLMLLHRTQASQISYLASQALNLQDVTQNSNHLTLDGICNKLGRLLLLLLSLRLVIVLAPLVVPLRDLGSHKLLDSIADSRQQAHADHNLQ